MDPRGTHKTLYAAEAIVRWREHQQGLHDYHCSLFDNSEFSDESATELIGHFEVWMCWDRNILWQEFERELGMLHRKRAKKV
jgi:hypothetical protein